MLTTPERAVTVERSVGATTDVPERFWIADTVTLAVLLEATRVPAIDTVRTAALDRLRTELTALVADLPKTDIVLVLVASAPSAPAGP